MVMRCVTTILMLWLLFAGQGALARTNGPVLHLNTIFGDNMVLQRGIELPVWGSAAPGARVHVTFNGQEQSTTADAEGSWRLKLAPMQAGGPFALTVADGTTSVVKRNVLIGDVWFCSGQSNMELPVSKFPDARQWLKDADYPNIRLFTVNYATEAASECKGSGWRACDARSAADFSATAFFFGKALSASQNVPIGLVSSSVSGSVIDAWIARDALQQIPEGRERIARYEKARADAAEQKKAYDAEMARRRTLDAEQVKALPALKPPPPVAQLFSRYFDGMVKPLIPFGIKGVIWYQGESNAMFAQGEPYRRMLAGLISDWRVQWGQGDFPFLLVQLPNYGKSNGCWPDLRDSQTYVAKTVPHTGLAVTIDIGDADNIHPPNKPEVGRRLALVARHEAYGENVVASGPIFQSMRLGDGGRITLAFDHPGDLVAKNAQSGNPQLTGFLVAGEDKRFHAAHATLSEGKVIVWSEQVKKPVAVRYAWADNPAGCNLYNRQGLPAAPFRTDDWPLPTRTKGK